VPPSRSPSSRSVSLCTGRPLARSDRPLIGEAARERRSVRPATDNRKTPLQRQARTDRGTNGRGAPPAARTPPHHRLEPNRRESCRSNRRSRGARSDTSRGSTTAGSRATQRRARAVQPADEIPSVPKPRTVISRWSTPPLNLRRRNSNSADLRSRSRDSNGTAMEGIGCIAWSDHSRAFSYRVLTAQSSSFHSLRLEYSNLHAFSRSADRLNPPPLTASFPRIAAPTDDDDVSLPAPRDGRDRRR
jgi:hypothetical protein